MAERVLQVLIANGAQRAMVFCGDDGLDELTTTTTSHVFESRGAAITSYVLDPSALGLRISQPDELSGGDAKFNAEAVHSVLGGELGAVRDISVLNAAAALQVADLAVDWESGLAMAVSALDSGAASSTLARWRSTALDAAAGEVQ